MARFAAIIANTWAIVYRSLKFQGFNLVISQIVRSLPVIIQAPRYFAQQITLAMSPKPPPPSGKLRELCHSSGLLTTTLLATGRP